MKLSDEQMRAVTHGLTNTANKWHEIERPVGPQPLPKWITGCHVDMMMGWANSPRIFIKVNDNTFFTPEDKWLQGPEGRWYRESKDGIVEQVWNRGRLQQLENGEWETERGEGFGGRGQKVEMADGRIVNLRGSWFGGTPEGYSELITVLPHVHAVKRFRKPWHKQMGTFGCYIPDHMLIAVLSKYVPHMPIARVVAYNQIEPFLAEWGCPKAFRENKQRGE